MFKKFSAIALMMAAGSSAGAQCYFSGGYLGEYIHASEDQYDLIRITPTVENKNLLQTVCNETYKAVRCEGTTRTYDQVVSHPSEFGIKEYTNFGLVEVTLGVSNLPEWIQQFVPNDWSGKKYASYEACLAQRDRIAIGTVEIAQKAIRYNESTARGSPLENQPDRRDLYTPGKW